MTQAFLRIHPQDNVAVALEPCPAGKEWQGVVARQEIPFGHKMALQRLAPGQQVIKYGQPIGQATKSIEAGEWVHSHNLGTALAGAQDYQYKPIDCTLSARPPGTFLGYARPGGRVGIRNELWLVPTVACVNGIAQEIAARARSALPAGVDGVYAFPHPYGCSQLGEDLENTQKALCGLICHPNAGGVLVLGLGCENNSIEAMKSRLGNADNRHVRFLECQQVADETAEGLRLLNELAHAAAEQSRSPQLSSKLVVGLKCGGSDGFSGITANPLVGQFSDRLVAEGGTAILTEVPEMFGGETLLMQRCRSRAVFEKTVHLINGFKDYFAAHGQPVYENPSPGNKAGGITTLEEKSLGCIQKGGSAPVTEVLGYGEAVTQAGLCLLQAPGNDLVAASALAVAGAQLVLFTTGRGTPFGAPVPTAKIATNTPLYENKRHWMDFDAGPVLGRVDMQQAADDLYSLVLALASGHLTRNEERGLREFALFKTGVTL